MSDFQKQYPESAALLKRLGKPGDPKPERVPEPQDDPTSTGYKGILLIVWLIGMIFVAVPFMVKSCSAPAWATTVLHQSFPDLAAKADAIVVGTVATIHAEWDTAHEIPYTLITFTDLDIRKGQARDTLTLQMLGGPDPDGNRMHVGGTPDFHLGDRLLLFIAGNTHVAIPLVGLWQGLYRVEFDPERNEEVVYTSARQPLTALPAQRGGVVYDALSAPLNLDAKSTATEPLTLDAMLQAIDEEVRHE